MDAADTNATGAPITLMRKTRAVFHPYCQIGCLAASLVSTIDLAISLWLFAENALYPPKNRSLLKTANMSYFVN
jgi:hypothetical protein